MPITLIESRDVSGEWHTGRTTLSAAIHVTLVTLAVIGTQHSPSDGEAAAGPERLIQVRYARTPDPVEPTPPSSAPAERRPAARSTERPDEAPVLGFQVLVAPIDIAVALPPIDLTRAVTDEKNFSGRGVAGGIAHALESRYAPEAPPAPDQPYSIYQVEKIAAPAGGCSPRFPERLGNAGIQGSVLVQFVVDTTGRAEPGSFKALSSEHDLFARAVRTALACMRYFPAEVGGRKVKQLVQQPFAFVLATR